MKIKDEVILKDYVYKIIIPLKLKKQIENYIPMKLKKYIIYINTDTKDIWDWSEKVYQIIESSEVKKR